MHNGALSLIRNHELAARNILKEGSSLAAVVASRMVDQKQPDGCERMSSSANAVFALGGVEIRVVPHVITVHVLPHAYLHAVRRGRVILRQL